MPLAFLIVVFIGVPIAELYLILQVGEAIGAPLTVLVLIADSVLGSVLLRSQGRSAWRRFARATREGRIPHQEVLDGVLVVFGGALLITPGFLTDVLGLALLLPPTRAVGRRLLVRGLGRRVLFWVADGPDGRAHGPRRRTPPYDVESSATEPRTEGERAWPRLER